MLSLRVAFCAGCGQRALIIDNDWRLLNGHVRRQHPDLQVTHSS